MEVVAYSLDKKQVPLAWCDNHFYALDKKFADAFSPIRVIIKQGLFRPNG